MSGSAKVSSGPSQSSASSSSKPSSSVPSSSAASSPAPGCLLDIYDFAVIDPNTFDFWLFNAGSENITITDLLDDATDVTSFTPAAPFPLNVGVALMVTFTTTTVPVSGVTISVFWTCEGGSSDSYSFVIP